MSDDLFEELSPKEIGEKFLKFLENANSVNDKLVSFLRLQQDL
jgi:hypothetical protein